MVNVYASQKECINISGDMIPLNEVINRLKRINLTHIQYVMECIGKSIKSIRRPNNYLLTALYNAPVTTDLYYAMQVKRMLFTYVLYNYFCGSSISYGNKFKKFCVSKCQ